MAKQSSVNLDITNNVDGFDISGGTTSRTLSVTGGSVILAGSGSATVTFPTTSTTIAGLGISQTFTALQSFSAGISAAGGITFASRIQGVGATFTGIVEIDTGLILPNSQNITSAVTTFNGASGAVSFAVPLASSSATGVASFGNQFVVTSGAVGLTSNYVKSVNGLTGAVVSIATTGSNVFTGLNTFNAGISASALTVSGGVTFSGNVYLGDNATGVTADSNDYVMMMGGTGSAAFKSGFYQTYKFLAGSTSGVICVTPAFNANSYLSGSATLEITISYTQLIAGPTTSNPRVHKIIMPIKWNGNDESLSLGDYTESITNSNSTFPPLTFTFAVVAVAAPYTRLSISTTTGADVLKSYSGWGFRTTVQVH